VPGNGTFNLTALWRALGIKNPQATITERLTPVIVAADLSQLTPLHPPATGIYGGTIGSLVGEFTTLVVDSRSPGGCLIPLQTWGRLVDMWSTPSNPVPTPGAGTVIHVPTGLFSRDAPVSRVRSFTTADVAPANSYTLIGGGAINPVLDLPLLWVPQGESVIFQNLTVGQNINIFSFFLRDLPAHDNPEA